LVTMSERRTTEVSPLTKAGMSAGEMPSTRLRAVHGLRVSHLSSTRRADPTGRSDTVQCSSVAASNRDTVDAVPVDHLVIIPMWIVAAESCGARTVVLE
jgi:hypothetical protein